MEEINKKVTDYREKRNKINEAKKVIRRKLKTAVQAKRLLRKGLKPTLIDKVRSPSFYFNS